MALSRWLFSVRSGLDAALIARSRRSRAWWGLVCFGIVLLAAYLLRRAMGARAATLAPGEVVG